MSDQVQIRAILGAVAGVVIGWAAGLFFPQIMIHTGFPAALFEHTLQLLLAPLLFTAIIVGVASFGDMAKVGRSFTKLFWYLFGTGAAAAVLALVLTMLFQPGNGVSWTGQVDMSQFDAAMGHSFGSVLQAIIPLNLPSSISNGFFTGLVLFAFAIGFFLIQAGFRGKPLTDLLSIFLSLQKKILQIIAYALPLGLFFIVGSAVAANAESFTASLQAISAIFPLLLVTLLLFGFIILPGIQWYATGEMPLTYLLNIKPAMATAFAAGSTTTAFPVLYQCVSEQQEDTRVTGTALPFGLLLGTHGSTILTVVLTIFTAQAVGVSLGLWQMLMLVLTAIFIPVGIVGFPAAQLVLISALFHVLQFPAEAYGVLAIVWGGEWLLSRFVAPVNVLSAAVGAAVVAGSFDLKTARQPQTHRPSASGPHRSDDQRRRGNYSQDQRGERRYRDRDDRSPDRERTPSHAGGGERRHSQGRDRFDRNKQRDGRGEHRQSERRGSDRHEGRPNRFQRDDRRRFPQDRPNREVPAETSANAPEQQPVIHSEERNEPRTFTPPTPTPAPEKQVDQNQERENVSYGRSSRPRGSERDTAPGGTDSPAPENRSDEKEPDFPASGDVSYGRSRRRPDFVRGESSSEGTPAPASEEESVVTGEVSFGRGRRRPPAR